MKGYHALGREDENTNTITILHFLDVYISNPSNGRCNFIMNRLYILFSVTSIAAKNRTFLLHSFDDSGKSYETRIERCDEMYHLPIWP